MLNADKIYQVIERQSNPFDTDKVLKARDSICDAPDIHKEAYRKLTEELRKVRAKGESRSVLVTGVAGSGKSHLIARLYRDRPKDVLFFQIQALPGGTHWFRHIVQCVVSDLEQPISHNDPSPQLGLLVKHFIDAAKSNLEIEAGRKPSVKELMWALEETRRQMEFLIPDPIVADILNVLGNFWKKEAPFGKAARLSRSWKENFRYLAYQWLKGMMIEDKELDVIGAKRNFASDPESGQTNFHTALRVFGALTKGRAPMILVFDQLDTMEPETVNSLGKQLLTLVGSDAAAPNFFIIIAGVDQQINDFIDNKIITQAVADVLFKTRLELPALKPEQCLRIVEQRLRPGFAPEDRLLFPPRADILFPFTTEYVTAKTAGPVMPTPRILISAMRGAYDEIDLEWLSNWPPPTDRQTEAPPWEVISDFLKAEFQNRLNDASESLIDDDTLLEMLGRILRTCEPALPFQLVGLTSPHLREACKAGFAIKPKGGGSRILGLLSNNKGHHASLNACLKRIQGCLDAGDHYRILLLRHFRAKSIKTWKVSREIISLLDPERFYLSDLKTDMRTLEALDDLRVSIPDLATKATKDHAPHQITEDDYRRYLTESRIVENLPVVRKATELLGIVGQQPVPAPKSYILARVTAKGVYSVDRVKLDWAGHRNKITLDQSEDRAVEKAVNELVKEGRIAVIGAGKEWLMKKL
jgi:hypothetical protein